MGLPSFHTEIKQKLKGYEFPSLHIPKYFPAWHAPGFRFSQICCCQPNILLKKGILKFFRKF